MRDNFDANRSKMKNPRGYATRFIYAWTKMFHSERNISVYNKLQHQSFAKHRITKEYEAIFAKEKFDLIFFTHQRPSYIAPMIYVAKKFNIPTATFIFSWDNLASKGRMAGKFDYFLVWSRLMKTELLHFYKKVKPENVAVAGTPQFEPYVLDRYKSDRKSFFKKFGLDENEKTICFSCGDIATSRNDELYITSIADAILSKRIEDVNFIVRTSPAEGKERFAELGKKYPWIIWNFPKWILSRSGHIEEWSQRIPSVEDVIDLRSILEFSDLNINMLSTMSLDFMHFDKPVINPVFGNRDNGLYNDQRFLSYGHITHVLDSGATAIAKNESDLVEAIIQDLNDPGRKAAKRKALIDLQIGRPLAGTSTGIASILKKWAL